MKLEFFEFSKNLKESELVVSWWQQRTGVSPEAILSDFAYMAYGANSKPVAALFLYQIKDSPVAMIGWPIANPETNSQERNLALNLLFDKLHEAAKSMGYKSIFTTTGVVAVADRLENLGYIMGDQNIAQYWKSLE